MQGAQPLVANGLVYGSLAISRHFRIKLQVKFYKSTKLSQTTAPPMNYIPCQQLGVIFNPLSIQFYSFILIIFSIYTNLSTKHKFILFFCVGQKALWANWVGFASSLTSFWVVCLPYGSLAMCLQIGLVIVCCLFPAQLF